MNRAAADELAAELRRGAPQLDLHGLYPEEAQSRVDQFLYENFNKKETSVEIIFGIGKGVMRRTVLDFLKTHPLVEKVMDKGGSCVVLLCR